MLRPCLLPAKALLAELRRYIYVRTLLKSTLLATGIVSNVHPVLRRLGTGQKTEQKYISQAPLVRLTSCNAQQVARQTGDIFTFSHL